MIEKDVKAKNFHISRFFTKSAIEAMEEACRMGAPERKSCEDAVSRRAVLDTLDKMDSVLDEDRTVETYKELLIACYNDLPPVTPERPKGHWINIDKTHSKCDKCESIFEIVSANGEANYCPNCGYFMSEGGKE